MKKATVQIVFWTAMIGLTPSPAHGQESLYRYTDRTGVQVYTNVQPTIQEAPELADRILAEQRKAAAEAARMKEKYSVAAPTVDPDRYNGIIDKYGDLHQVDPKLIKAVIRAESNFNHRAVSPKGAKGLMQLMPGTAQRYGVNNIFDPEENIQGGVRYLRFLLDLFNEDLKHTIAAYNAGENAVLRVGGIPPYRETIDYVKRVTRFYGSEKHRGATVPSNPFGVYVYRAKDGSLMLTNVDPPPVRGSNP